MLEAYRHHAAERAALGIPPLPLSAQQTAAVIELLKNPPAGEEAFLVDLLSHHLYASYKKWRSLVKFGWFDIQDRSFAIRCFATCHLHNKSKRIALIQQT